MAKTGRQQLKVWNRFNTGEENVMDKHLIRDTGFVTAENVFIDDATIRPLRGYSVESVYPTDVKHVIKENIKGDDRLIEFNTPVRYVNYNNAVYYVSEEGSPLMMAYSDGGVTAKHRPVNTRLSDLTVEVTGAPSVAYNPFQGITDAFSTPVKNALVDYEYIPAAKALFDVYGAALRGNNNTHTLGDRVQTAVRYRTSMIQLATDLRNQLPDKPISEQFVDDLHTFPFKTEHGIYVVQTVLQKEPMAEWKPDFREQKTLASIIKHADAYLQVLQWYKDRSYMQFVSYTNPLFPDENVRLSHEWLDNRMRTLRELKSRIPAEHASKTEDDLTNPETLQWYRDRMIYGGSYTRNIGCRVGMRKELDILMDTIFLLGNANIINPWIHRVMTSPADTDASRKYINRCNAPRGTMHDLNGAMTTLKQDLQDTINKVTAVDVAGTLNTQVRYYGVLLWDNATGSTSYVLRDVPVNAPSGSTLHFKLNTSQGGKYRAIVLERDINSSDWRRVHTRDNLIVSRRVAFNLTVDGTGYVKDTQIHTIRPTDNQEHDNYDLIAEHRGTLFMGQTGKQEVRFTYPNQPNVTDDQHVFMVPQPVKALQSAGAGVFIFTTNRTVYLLTGHELKDVKIKRIGEGVGVLSAGAVGAVDNLVIWMSKYGIHNTSGYGSSLSTKRMWRPPADKGVPERTVILNGVVYFIYPKGFIISYDYSKHIILKYQLSKDIKSVSIINGGIFALLSDGKLVKSFAGTKLFNYKVELKRFAGYSFDTRLRFNNVTIAHDDVPYRREGVATVSNGATVTIYVDEREVAKQDIKGYGASRIHIPMQNNTGESVSIAIEGDLRIRSARLRYTTHNYED